MGDAPFAIRSALPGDAEAIARVHVRSWQEAYVGIMPQETLEAISFEARSRRWSTILETDPSDPAFGVFVAETDGAIVGFGSVARQRDETLAGRGFDGEFTAIYVLAAHHGSGIAQALMAEMGMRLAGAGIAAASVWVLEDNQRARRFYPAVGSCLSSSADEATQPFVKPPMAGLISHSLDEQPLVPRRCAE